MVGDSQDSYSHSANTSTYATLFAIGLGIEGPENLGIAGLLHDIGLNEVPHGILQKKESERTKVEQANYEKHIDLGMNIIRSQRLILPDAVSKAIQCHHERYNGTGYPKGIPGSKIPVEAQILSIADKFDEITSLEAGQARMSPVEAIQYFKNEVAQDLSKLWYDPQLMNKILALLS